MQKITPCLWFDGKTEEAMNFYVSVFPRAKVTSLRRIDVPAPGPGGEVVTASFELDGQAFIALDGGPLFTFSPAISFYVRCDTQEEIDHYWEKLSEGGETQDCGWLKDRYGVSWQIVPSIMDALLYDKDAEEAGRAVRAMLSMKKLDIAALISAHAGG